MRSGTPGKGPRKSDARKSPAAGLTPSPKLPKGRLNADRLAKKPERTPTSRERKDIAMITARGIAGAGGYTGWKHVLETYESRNPGDVTLRLWASASDRWEIDRLCSKWLRAQPRRR